MSKNARRIAVILPAICLIVILGTVLLSGAEEGSAAAMTRELTPEQRAFALRGIVLEKKTAPTQLIVTDYRCPACQALVERSRSVGTILHIDNHRGSMEAHALGLCVYRADPGLYARTERDFYTLGASELRRRLGDVEGLDACLHDPATQRRLEAEHQLGVTLGARVTPTRITLGDTQGMP